jgi:hypothetical protein
MVQFRQISLQYVYAQMNFKTDSDFVLSPLIIYQQTDEWPTTK